MIDPWSVIEEGFASRLDKFKKFQTIEFNAIIEMLNCSLQGVRVVIYGNTTASWVLPAH